MKLTAADCEERKVNELLLRTVLAVAIERWSKDQEDVKGRRHKERGFRRKLNEVEFARGVMVFRPLSSVS